MCLEGYRRSTRVYCTSDRPQEGDSGSVPGWEELRLQEMWHGILARYGKTELSNLDDRLSALAGIAEMIQIKLCYKPSHCLWLDFFTRESRWIHKGGRGVKGPRKVLKEFRDAIPTWSWVPTRGDISIDSDDDQEQELYSAKIIKYPPVAPFQRIPTFREQLPKPISRVPTQTLQSQSSRRSAMIPDQNIGRRTRNRFLVLIVVHFRKELRSEAAKKPR